MGPALALYATGTAFNLWSQYEQGEMNEATYAHNARMAEFDAALSKLSTENQLKRLSENESRIIGTFRANAGASGFAVDQGSNADVIADTRRSVAIDAAAIRLQGSINQFRIQSEADRYRTMAENSDRNTRVQMFGTILGDATKYAAATGAFKPSSGGKANG